MKILEILYEVLRVIVNVLELLFAFLLVYFVVMIAFDKLRELLNGSKSGRQE